VESVFGSAEPFTRAQSKPCLASTNLLRRLGQVTRRTPEPKRSCRDRRDSPAAQKHRGAPRRIVCAIREPLPVFQSERGMV